MTPASGESSVVFFDLDGTLTDPKVGIVRSIHYALDRLEIEPSTEDDLTWCIGPPLLDSFRTIVGSALAPKAVELYRERFSEIGWQENEVYPEIVDVLRQLSESGKAIYVATSKPLIFAARIVEYFELRPFFSGVFGSELDGTRANKGELLCYALSKVGVARDAVMVGDREHDINGAKENQMRSIGVTYGYGKRRELEDAGADEIVETPQQLVSILV